MPLSKVALSVSLCCVLSVSSSFAADWGMKEGTPDIKSAGALAFGPEGILFIGDAKGATVFAISTGDTNREPSASKLQVEGLNKQVAKLLGTESESITINDIATNPITSNVFLSVTKGKSADAAPAIVRVNGAGQLNEISLRKVPFQKAVLPSAPEDKEISRNGRTMNPRNDTITDLAYIDGKVFASGLGTGNAPSSVQQIPFPFSDSPAGSSVEIFHGAHGRVESSSAIRTFVPMNINGEPSLLAGFVCTPLVRFPISSLKSDEKARGTTVAELGNHNRPLDMIVYKKDGKDFLLLSNSDRGVMKISTENIARNDGITEKINDTAGQSYETIKELVGVVQLDRLNEDSAVVLISVPGGSQDLRSVPLP